MCVIITDVTALEKASEESECQCTCDSKSQLWYWKNRALVAEKKLSDKEKEEELIEARVQELIEKMKGE